MKIVVVGDSSTMRMLVLRSLRKAQLGQHEFFEAGSGRETIALLGKSPDVGCILSAWNMTEMDGIDLLQEVRKISPTIIFGVVASPLPPEIRRRGVEAGASFFVTEPFSPPAFKEALRPFLG